MQPLHSPPLLESLLETAQLRQMPLTLLDIGCSGGIARYWNAWKPALRAFGVDPMIDEIDRLRNEAADHVRYECFAIGLDADHPFVQARSELVGSSSNCLERGWLRWFKNRLPEQGAGWNAGTNKWRENDLTEERITLSEFRKRMGIGYIDFLKIDTDGSDLEILVSAESSLEESRILGLLVEARFAGSPAGTDNVFGNIDAWMRTHGFKLFDLSMARMARSALPRPFEYGRPGQTSGGQLAWGDFLYLRDPVDERFCEDAGFQAEEIELLKLVGLFDMFDLADCAAELLIHFRDRLCSAIDVESLLDKAASHMAGVEMRYGDYVETFESNARRLF